MDLAGGRARIFRSGDHGQQAASKWKGVVSQPVASKNFYRTVCAGFLLCGSDRRDCGSWDVCKGKARS